MIALQSKKMHPLWVLALLVAGCLRPQVRAPPAETEVASTASGLVAAPGPVPYTLAFTGHKLEDFPGVHSGTYAVDSKGRLVFIGGRANGMHNFPEQYPSDEGQRAFPPSKANRSVWVIDLDGRKVLGSKSTDDLPEKIRNQWRATNAQHLEQNGYLIIAGGYGQTSGGKSMETLGYATSVRLDALIAAVLDPQVKLNEEWARQNVGVADHMALQVAGGEMASLGDLQLLVFGHNFNGEYTQSGSLATQTYTESVRRFQFTPDIQNGKAALTVKYLGQTPEPAQRPPDNPYHRRDLTVGPTRTGSGALRITAYGGVFKGGRMEGYLTPIYVGPNATGGITVEEDTAAEQLLSQYNCAAIPIFQRTTKSMYTTLVGGISYYYWDEKTMELKHDEAKLPERDGLPFINSVSTLWVPYDNTGQRQTTKQYLHSKLTFPPVDAVPQCGSMPAPLGGAGAVFIPDPKLERGVRDGVLDYENLPDSGRIGWVLGGIAATDMYSGANKPTCASNMLYEVELTKKQGNVIELRRPEAPPPSLVITTSGLPLGQIRQPYHGLLQGTGGVPPYTWAIKSHLPVGLLLAPNSGVIEGIPFVVGTQELNILLTDSAGNSAEARVYLTIGTGR